jgi:hypothetical protein
MVTRAYSWCLAALLFVGVVVHISYCALVDRQKEASYREQAIRDAYCGSYALCLVVLQGMFLRGAKHQRGEA